MEKITNLNGLLVNNLQALYEAEKRQLRAYPELAGRANDYELKQILTSQIHDTQEQVNRLEESFQLLGIKPAESNRGFVSDLISRTLTTADRINQTEVADAGIIGAVQQVKHFGIANYGTAAAHASALGFKQVADLLHKNLTEEKNTDQRLSSIAEKKVNVQAIKA